MDFDLAVNKLARNHSKQLRRGRILKNSNISGNRHSSSHHLSLRAKKEAEERKRKTEEQRKIQQAQKNKLRKTFAYFKKCEQSLGTEYSLAAGGDGRLLLKPTSIHGEGDKIALPVSVLPILMDFKDKNVSTIGASSSPFEFRVGILNPDYKFPMSPSLKNMMENMNGMDDDIDDDMSMEDSDDEDENAPLSAKDETTPFLDELSYKYLSYTHCTVVEFTQEEGHVGLPQSIAQALLNNDKNIAVTKTVDPASSSQTSMNSTEKSTKEHLDEEMEDVEELKDSTLQTNIDDGEEDKTPGHLAWGAFNVPDLKVEIALVKLPKGKACTLIPTTEAVQNGFHQLKDIKAVLEQSLIRTKATLSMNDNVHCWHRGKKFDMTVSSLTPNTYNAVSCINTDIEVDIGSIAEESDLHEKRTEKSHQVANKASGNDGGRVLGRSLGSNDNDTTEVQGIASSALPIDTLVNSNLPPEPSPDEKENVCLIQIRGDGKTGRRRFDIQKSTVNNLYVFAASVVENQIKSFRLVTRFPRKVIELQDASLKDAGVNQGQELFMIEKF